MVSMFHMNIFITIVKILMFIRWSYRVSQIHWLLSLEWLTCFRAHSPICFEHVYFWCIYVLGSTNNQLNEHFSSPPTSPIESECQRRGKGKGKKKRSLTHNCICYVVVQWATANGKGTWTLCTGDERRWPKKISSNESLSDTNRLWFNVV